jgi:hypothetical protein
MGAAAYNRGSNAIRRDIDANMRPVAFEVMDRLNDLPKYSDAGTPFGSLRFESGNGGFWALCPRSGFGFWYPTLSEAVRRWRVQIVAFDGGWEAEPE